ncbi:DsbA family oxidoreductase [Actinotalea ferrariae]|uniref:DsbA family oxidoreductase n=1 Tax=Actinotalea ferrariae TaxID=1386098 RepID=UPI001C8C919B|nr:DsbA family oxidoreductase [Actinotalea ferrariae]MBX9246643.1 DsbA family oxidoreductase [Actinotalea ferrariae]
MAAEPTVLTVDVWSDIACPWCFIGKRRFEEGLRLAQERRSAAGEPPLDVRLTFHSFELAPDTPVDFEGTEVDFLAGHKGLPAERVGAMLTQVTEIAASVGLRYDFDALRHTNTLKAHQVLHLALARGRQAEVAERLFRAYFEEGRHLGHDDELAVLAAEAGLDAQEVRDALAAGTYVADVVADMEQARAYGISGVPFFVLDGRFGVSGAQPAELFASALEQASAAAPETAHHPA